MMGVVVKAGDLASELDGALPAGWTRGSDTPRGYPAASIITGADTYGLHCAAEVFWTPAEGIRAWVWSVWRQIWTEARVPYPGHEVHALGTSRSAEAAVATATRALESAQVLLAQLYGEVPR